MSHLEAEELETIAAYQMVAHRYAAAEEHLFADHRVYRLRASMPRDPVMLEIGCGHGRSIPIFHSIGIPRFVGIDPASNLVTIGKERWPEADLRVMSVYDLPRHFPPGSFDAFWACASLMHVARHRMPEALAAIRSVLGPQAVGLITLPHGNATHHWYTEDDEAEKGLCITVHRWTIEDLRPILSGAGLQVIEELTSQVPGEMLYAFVEVT